MFKTVFIGIVLGALGTGALARYVPAVDLHRERSMISVVQNGGNLESFHINLPRDRILVGLPDDASTLPAELDWPGSEHLPGLQAEVFKLRDGNDNVVGIASRLASAEEISGRFIEWVLHLPARGSLYVGMGVEPDEEGRRQGDVRAGTGEFGELSGTMSERLLNEVDTEYDIDQRIELQTRLIGRLEEET